jgi:predicted nucleotidyltransferase
VTLTTDQLSALRELEQVWPDTNTVIIGATALGFYIDMRWRKTHDVDLVVAIERDDFPGALADRAGWHQTANKEHEFTSPRGMKIDILPAGEALIAEGRITWQSGHVMNLAGMDLAFAHETPKETIDSGSVLVAPPAVIAILKMAAFCDGPDRRERDLADIAHLLQAYEADNDERLWSEGLDARDYDLVCAYLLGLDVGRIVETDVHRELVAQFLDHVGDPEGHRHWRMVRCGPRIWESEVEPLARRLDDFRAGMAAAQRG